MRLNRETRHESQSSRLISRSPRADCVRNAGPCRHECAAVPACERRHAGGGGHSRGRAVAHVPRPPRAPGQVGFDRLPRTRPSVGQHRGGHAAPGGHWRLPLRARDAGDRSRVGCGAGPARPRAVARPRTGRGRVGDRLRRCARAVSEDRLSHLRGVGALLRHQHGRQHWLPGPARTAQQLPAGDARCAGSSSGPWRRARRSHRSGRGRRN